MIFRRRLPLPLPAQPECHVVGAVLQAFLDGELGADDAEIVAAHLEHCERCGIERATTQRVITAIRRQRPDLDAALVERLTGFVDRIGDHPTDPDRPDS